MSTRVLLLSALDPLGRPDTSVEDVTADLFLALSSQPGVEVVQAEVGSAPQIERAVRQFRPHAVFNFCEALAGESRLEPLVPLVLERLGVAFTGSPSSALRTCLDKFETNEILRRGGVPVPSTARVTNKDVRCDLRYPVIVKPEREDGSVGIDASSVVHSDDALRLQVLSLLETYGRVVVQEYVEGREVACALLGYPQPRVLPLGEITFGEALREADMPNILTYASKWDPESLAYDATRSVTAAIEPVLAGRIAAVARRTFELLGMRDYGRVDMRVTATGEPLVIDVNPNCDVSRDGGFMRAARRQGIRYEDAVATILRCALMRTSSEPGNSYPPPPHEPSP
jgi:D-alanine-D-alanine ligase